MDESIQLIIQRMNELSKRIKSLQEAGKKFLEEIAVSKEPVDTGKKFAENLEGELNTSSQSIEEVLKLLQGLGPKPQPIKTEDLAQHFRSVVDSIQQSRPPQQGEVATILKNLDVEIKGLIVVQDNEARIATPTPDQAIDAGQLSTLRMSFNTIPVLRQPSQKPPAEPQPAAEPTQEQKEEQTE